MQSKLYKTMPLYAKMMFFSMIQKTLKSRENLANTGKKWQRKVRKNYDKSIVRLPRQLEWEVIEVLDLLGLQEIW